MADLAPSEVCAVVVAYHPDWDALRARVDAIATQVGKVVLVINACSESDRAQAARLVGRCEVIAEAANTGLAAAQNRGIAWARSNGFAAVLLLDQDSLPASGMVQALLDGRVACAAGGVRVGAVGPGFLDPRDGAAAPFVRIGFPFNRKLFCTPGAQAIDCDFLISSGSLVTMDVLDAVGAMDEGLFVDNVDLEWSFRARSRGYRLFGICAARMRHALGEARRPLPLGLRSVVVHSPLRLYYMMRNRVRLYALPHTPWRWIAQDMMRLPVKFFLFAVIVGPRWKNVRYMLRGLLDGIRGRVGVAPLSLCLDCWPPDQARPAARKTRLR